MRQSKVPWTAQPVRFPKTGPLAVVFTFSLIVLIFRQSFIRDGDIFWHLRAGEWIVQHLAVPHVDEFSYTAKGQPWIDLEWLSEIIFVAAYKIGNWAGVRLLAASACALSITLLTFYLLRHLRLSVAIAWAAITSWTTSLHFLARPHVFSFIILIIWFVAILEAYDRRRLESVTLLLVPLMIVWANLHGSFLYGLAVYGVFSGFAFVENWRTANYTACRQLASSLLIISLAAAVTPYGFQPALAVLDVSRFQFVVRHIAEWKSPDFQTHWPLSLSLTGLLAGLLYLGAKTTGPRLVVLCSTLYFGLSHGRGLILFFLTAPILLAKPVALTRSWLHQNLIWQTRAQEQTTDPVLDVVRRFQKAVHLSIVLLIPMVAWLQWGAIARPPSQAVAPRAAVDFVENFGRKGNVFNDYTFGGYLIYRNIPVFVDSRQPPYSDAFVRIAFETVELADTRAAFKLLDEYHISWTLLLPTQPLTKALQQDPGWKKLYSDQFATVFVRADPIQTNPSATR